MRFINRLTSQLARKPVIDIAMMRFVGAHDEDHVAQCGVGRKFPIVDRNGRCGHVRRATFIDFLKIERVAEHRLFFKIADDAVCSPRRHKVKQEKANIENPLREHHDQPLKKRGLRNLHKRHQMHALVFGLLHQCTNPAIVIDHAAQASEVLDGAANHTRNGGDSFENDGAMAIAFGKENIRAPAQKFGEGERDVI